MPQSLSPRQFAEAIGISESTVRRWSDAGRIEITRTKGGHRRISRAEAVRFVRDHDTPLVHPELLGFHEPTHRRQRTEAFAAQHEQFFRALEQGKGEVAVALLKRMYVNGVSVAAICDGPLRNAMKEIGEIWHSEKRGVFVEHQATGLCVDALIRLRGEFKPPAEDAPMAMGGAPENDPYILPTLAASTVFAELGFQTINLGPNTPLQALANAAIERKAAVVWLALTAALPKSVVNSELESLASGLREAKIPLILGGRSVKNFQIPDSANVHQFASMAEMAGFGKALR